ncbi:MAG: hypothetical protein QOE44_356 [Solirubrobacteraceae bacterium]|jgi:GAF domain-containing protein|nr:hypothetical protein [Solirubrobacteraceae bacterium]
MAAPESRPTDQDVLDALAAVAAARERDVITRALEAARERLAMDAAYVSSVTPETQRVDELVGVSAHMGFTVGTTLPLTETYCDLMLRGELPNLVPDTRVEPRVAHLSITDRVGAYIGVPIRLADGRLHGTLCCASGEARTGFGDDEVHFMEVLAGIVATEIDRSEESRAEAADRLLDRSPGRPSSA